MRVDYEVSTPEIDALVEWAKADIDVWELGAVLGTLSLQLASPNIPSWNQLFSFLRQMGTFAKPRVSPCRHSEG